MSLNLRELLKMQDPKILEGPIHIVFKLTIQHTTEMVI